MFRKMMVCTDLTPASDVLIGCAAALKEIGVREVVLGVLREPFGVQGVREGLRPLGESNGCSLIRTAAPAGSSRVAANDFHNGNPNETFIV